MNEIVRGRLVPTVERQAWISRYIWVLLVEVAVIWSLVFGLLGVLFSFGASPVHGELSIAADAAREATLVAVALLILRTFLPAE
jgi:hypothetical protein